MTSPQGIGALRFKAAGISLDQAVSNLGSQVMFDWWLNETGTTTVSNHSSLGSGWNGTLSGSYTQSQGVGPNGRAYTRLSGGKVTAASSLTEAYIGQVAAIPSGLSVIGLFKPSSARFEHFATNTNSTPRYHWGAHINGSTGVMNFTHWGQLGSTRSNGSSSSGAVVLNAWNLCHWLIASDALDADIQLYSNSTVDRQTGAESHSADDAEFLATVILGARGDGANFPLSADVARFVICKPELTVVQFGTLVTAAQEEGWNLGV